MESKRVTVNIHVHDKDFFVIYWDTNGTKTWVRNLCKSDKNHRKVWDIDVSH